MEFQIMTLGATIINFVVLGVVIFCIYKVITTLIERNKTTKEIAQKLDIILSKLDEKENK